MSEHEEKFEKMLQTIQNEYNDTVSKMEKLRVQDKTKTVTYKQHMGTKVALQNMLLRYEIYGLLEREVRIQISWKEIKNGIKNDHIIRWDVEQS